MFDRIATAPAVQDLARRVESRGALSLGNVCLSAQPFIAALLHQLFPQRPIVVVTDGLKTQESFQQDIETWLAVSRASKVERREPDKPAEGGGTSSPRPSTLGSRPLFYPAWEILPHEPKLPHADVISERLETLVALAADSRLKTQDPRLIVTNVTALLQRTFAPGALAERTRTLRRGDRANPLDLIEWLEEQAYEPEAQVTAKGELALRGGIVDVWPLTCPWPVRLEFFGDELESLRQFDPLTQMSRDGGDLDEIILPPAGELGILKRSRELGVRSQNVQLDDAKHPESRLLNLASVLDYLPSETIFLLCEPELLVERAEAYAAQVLEDDPFFICWEEFKRELATRGMLSLELSESDAQGAPGTGPLFVSLDAFRPLGERPPEPQVAEAQRREFFAQLHRWTRQGYAVHVFCNNDGEQQRFEEIWGELGLAAKKPLTHLGTLARGFLFDEAKIVIVTDAEIFGRYKVQRPRRLKSPHAAAMRSALDIDFTELSPGDLVVHLQHGIGRFVGLQTLPTMNVAADVRRRTDGGESSASSPRRLQESGTECLVIEYAETDPDQPPPKLYVPVTEAHLVSKYVGAGKVRPPLNQLGGHRWAKAKEQAEHAVRDLAAELLAIQAARETQAGHAFKADTPWQREFEGSFVYEETPDQSRAIVETKTDMERPKPMDRLICGDVGYGKTEVAIRAAFKAVMDGRQVAVLVPTTVLAQQHFNTFRERMADYPVRIELLSRFRTRREQARVVRDLA
ncbi:MAG: DEAD/DEAH box helicase, partial [Verrucomicrobia bacterium]|nr:DEAD/DEAH box helicase [Verrucomicrobiota bacterium]